MIEPQNGYDENAYKAAVVRLEDAVWTVIEAGMDEHDIRRLVEDTINDTKEDV